MTGTAIPRPPTRELPFGAECYAVNLQIRAPAETADALARLREQLAAATGLAMHFAPADSLHLTVFSVVYVRAVYPVPPSTVWAAVERPIVGALRAATATEPPFQLTFDRAGLRGDAVLVESDPHPRLEALRDAVEQAMADIAPVFRSPTTHSTIARLAEPVRTAGIRPLRAWVADETIAWPVDGLRLVLERRYPALDEEEIERFPFARP